MGSKENKNDDELFSLFYDGGYFKYLHPICILNERLSPVSYIHIPDLWLIKSTLTFLERSF